MIWQQPGPFSIKKNSAAKKFHNINIWIYHDFHYFKLKKKKSMGTNQLIIKEDESESSID